MRRRLTVIVTLLTLLLAADLAIAQDPFKELELIRPSRVKAARDFTALTPDGKSIKLSSYRGKVVFLNFWATWCTPCREEMPSMERLYQRFKDQGLVVVGLSIDAEGASVVIPFVKELKLTFPIGLDPKLSVTERYQVRALPSSFLIDKKGNLVALAIGPRDWDSKAAHAVIEALLTRG